MNVQSGNRVLRRSIVLILLTLALSHNWITRPALAAGNTHGGSWAIQGTLPATANFKNISQVPSVTGSSMYVASLWIEGTGSVQLYVKNGNWGATSLASAQCNATATWTQCTTPSFSTGANTQVTYIIQNSYNTAGTVYVDDTFLGVSGGANVLTNPGLESGNTGWALSDAAVWAIVQPPGTTPVPTATPLPATATPTKTHTPLSATNTSTATPSSPTNTLTKTNTPAAATVTPLPTSTLTRTNTPPPAPGTIRVESGGTVNFTDSGDNVWAADNSFSGGSTADRGAIAIANTADDRIYQTERYGNPFSYAFNVANGTYTVNLHFAETFFTSSGQRVFSVAAEGTTIISNLDIFAAAGANAALIRTANVTVNDGQLNLNFTASVNNALVNGIEIIPGSSPTATPTPTRTNTPTGPTNTPAPPTATPTKTNTPAGGPTPATSIRVDYSQPIRPVRVGTFGIDASGYGGSNKILPTDPLMQTRITALHLGRIRVHLVYATPGNPSSPIQCGGDGCFTNANGDQWVNAIKAAGAEPVLVTSMYVGNVNLSVSDAVNLVRHFNVDTANPVKRWILGNEQQMTTAEYISQFNQMYDAMKAVDSTLKIGGPAAASFNQTYLQNVLNGTSSRIDVVDFHQYGEGGTENLTEVQLLSKPPNYETNINTLRTMIQNTVPSRAAQIEIQVGEWNMNWNTQGSVALMYEQFNCVWTASVIGHMLNADGLSLLYGDKNLALGALYEQTNDRMPAYYGTGMYTGLGLFQPFGATLVTASTSLSNVEVYASDNPKNIVVINKELTLTHTATIGFTGLSAGVVDVWRKDQNVLAADPPVYLGTVMISNGQFSYSLPPYSVTTFAVR